MVGYQGQAGIVLVSEAGYLLGYVWDIQVWNRPL